MFFFLFYERSGFLLDATCFDCVMMKKVISRIVVFELRIYSFFFYIQACDGKVKRMLIEKVNVCCYFDLVVFLSY